MDFKTNTKEAEHAKGEAIHFDSPPPEHDIALERSPQIIEVHGARPTYI